MMRQLGQRSLFLLLVGMSVVALASCSEEDNAAQPGDQPDESGFSWDLVTTDSTVPQGFTGNRLIEFVDNRDDFEESWERFGFSDEPPLIDWNERAVLFFATGESGSCPLELTDVTYDNNERLIEAYLDRDVPPDTACTADWNPRTFVVSVPSSALADDDLYADMIFDRADDSGRDPDPEQVR